MHNAVWKKMLIYPVPFPCHNVNLVTGFHVCLQAESAEQASHPAHVSGFRGSSYGGPCTEITRLGLLFNKG